MCVPMSWILGGGRVGLHVINTCFLPLYALIEETALLNRREVPNT